MHHASMDGADRSMQLLARWIDDNGYRSNGYARKVTIQFDPDGNWIHEFQIPITR